MPIGLVTKGRSFARATSVVALAVSASFATSAQPARADGQTTIDDAQRTEIYREAVRAASAGRWGEAKERLRAVLAIRPSPKVYFSLAQAEEQLGQLASAQADYARALEGAATEGKGDVVQAAELAQRALLPRVPHVRIVVSSANASATIDNRQASTGTPVAVDPGDHRLIVSAPAMRTTTLTVRLSEGQQLDVPVSLEAERSGAAVVGSVPPVPPVLPVPLPSPSSARANAAPSIASSRPAAANAEDPHETTSSASSSWRTVGAVTASVGVIALGVGVVFGLDSKSKHDAAAKVCPDSTCANANDAKLWHDAVSAGNASTIAFVVGALGIVGGAVLWFAAPSSSGTSSGSSRSNGASAEVGLGPGSVHLRGAW